MLMGPFLWSHRPLLAIARERPAMVPRPALPLLICCISRLSDRAAVKRASFDRWLCINGVPSFSSALKSHMRRVKQNGDRLTRELTWLQVRARV